MSTTEHVLNRKMPAAERPQKRRPPSLWAVRGEISRSAYLMFALAGLLVPLLSWWALASAGLVAKVFMPGPLDVVHRLSIWWTDDGLLTDIGISMYRVCAGWALSALVAVPLGLLIGTFKPMQALLEPLTDFIRYMPAVAFIPLVMLWVGIDEGSKIAIIFIGTFFQMVLMIAENVRFVPLAQVEAAQTMGASREELVRLVIFPSAKPAVLDTLRITMGWAWTYLVVAELVAANTGLGYSILKAQRYLQTDKIFAGILLIGLIGLVIDQAFRLSHRLLFSKWMAKR
ncbi:MULTISPECIES: ABC transporter permease [Paraburkholderia]|uniref:Aliphatic sulfonates transport permease protein SsuC n=1 Tax=Paraburkholderia fynbosensis TaxID=1200993 RepID=A0A6J5GZ81_9BURK|nr:MULTISPECIES: ABC transporter permease [Paraburkholderia]RKT22195.1 NitT/TauT family transport system permease protein [Paraburkholderia sp. RAU2J]CAB3809362.1 Putative aliphatic sulfonates transport permease protein SsuC [Paraburkholderia fynbosensis]